MYDNNELVQKSIRLEKNIVERIEKDSKNEQRNFTQQLTYIIKKYYDLQDEFNRKK